MAILKIARMGHPGPAPPGRARGRPDRARNPGRWSPTWCETLADIGGAGLAAPQVHVPLAGRHLPGARGAGPSGPGDRGRSR